MPRNSLVYEMFVRDQPVCEREVAEQSWAEEELEMQFKSNKTSTKLVGKYGMKYCL